MNRRSILKMAGTTGLSLTQTLAWSQSGPVRLRRSAADIQAEADLQAFGDAVKKMLAVPDARDPDSWMYWANVHGMPGGNVPPPLRRIWRTCDHDRYFLAWHRLYLIYFEATIARLSGKSDFAMPYWDWYRSAEIPLAFANPASNTNPLWRSGRGYSRRYTISTVALEESDYPQFNTQSFGDPHSPIHVNFRGEMSSPPTAARDPVFWAHHAAMDRLWEVWLASDGTHVNPPPQEAWASRVFHFLPGGPPAGSRPVSSALALAELGYGYDTLALAEPVTEMLPPKPKRVEVGAARQDVQSAQSAPGLTTVSERRHIQLTGEPLTVRLPLSAAAGPAMAALGAPQGPVATLRLDGIQLTPEGARRGVVYDIYINLPTARPQSSVAGTGAVVRHRIGQVSSFGLAEHAGHGDGHPAGRVEFSITRLVPRLKAADRWDPTMVEIDFIEPSDPGNPVPLITIEQIALLMGGPGAVE